MPEVEFNTGLSDRSKQGILHESGCFFIKAGINTSVPFEFLKTHLLKKTKAIIEIKNAPGESRVVLLSLPPFSFIFSFLFCQYYP